MEKRISDRGYYPIRLSRDEVDAWAADPGLVDVRFKAEIVHGVERWMAHRRREAARLADPLHRLAGQRRHVRDRRDHRARRTSSILGEAVPIDLEGLTMISTGWTNPTPWNTFRELPEDQLRAKIDELVKAAPDPHRAIFNFHVPPYGSNLDNAPKLDAAMNYVSGGQALIPVGSHAVRDAILEYGPVLSLHGHIHEGRGAVKLGRTLAVNPGQYLRGRRAPGGDRRPGHEEGIGEALSADQRLTFSDR